MYRHKMRIKLGILLGVALLITGLIVPLVIAQEDPALTVVEAAANHHIRANNLVNARLQALALLMEEMREDPDTRETVRNRFASVTPEICLNEDEELNLSVSCLREALLKEQRDFFSELADPNLPLRGTTDSDILSIIGTASGARQVATKDMQTKSEEMMTQTTDAYAQIVLANVLHQENLVTIDEIDELQDNLKQLQKEIQQLPFKFVNVSTSECK